MPATQIHTDTYKYISKEPSTKFPTSIHPYIHRDNPLIHSILPPTPFAAPSLTTPPGPRVLLPHTESKSLPPSSPLQPPFPSLPLHSPQPSPQSHRPLCPTCWRVCISLQHAVPLVAHYTRPSRPLAHVRVGPVLVLQVGGLDVVAVRRHWTALTEQARLCITENRQK